MLYFSIQNARGGREKEPRLRGGLRTDGFMVGSWSDHSRIMVGSFIRFQQISLRFWTVIFRGRRSIW